MKNIILKLFIFSCLTIILSSCTTSEIPLPEVIVPPPVPVKITYDADVKSIMTTNCISCHVTGGAASFLPLTTYAEVKNSAENGNLIPRMNNMASPMPPSGLLSAEMRTVLDKWKVDGFLEN